MNSSFFKDNLLKGSRSNWFGGLKQFKYNLFWNQNITKEIIKAIRIYSDFVITNYNVQISNIKNKKNIANIIIFYTRRKKSLLHSKIKDIIVQHFNNVLKSDEFNINNIDVINDKKPNASALFICQEVDKALRLSRINEKKLEYIALKPFSSGCKGCSIRIKGKINGNGIARSIFVKVGSIPKGSINAEIDKWCLHSVHKIGVIGVRVLIYKSDIKCKKENSQS